MASLRSSRRCSPRLGPTRRRRRFVADPDIQLAAVRVRRSCSELCAGRFFATGGRHLHQSNTWTRRHTLDVNALADRQGARPHHLGGAVQAELRAASIPHVILCQRLSSGIKETVLRDRTEFPVKHAQLLDQEPPSQREFSHTMPGLRVANTGGARYENEPHDRHVENATVPVDICWW